MRKLYIFGLIGLAATIIGIAWAEQFTLSTYYPAPYGVYREMRATRMAVGDNFHKGGDYPWDEDGFPGPSPQEIHQDADLVVEGNVGIGTATTSGAKLHVSGDGDTILVPVKSTDTDPTGSNGMIYYNEALGRFRVYESGGWKDSAGGGGIGSWTNEDSNSNPLVKNKVYQVGSDGFVCAYVTPSSVYIYGYTDDTDATTVRFKAESAHAATGNPKGSFTMPVRRGDFWKIASNGTPDSIYWLPIGSGTCVEQ